MKKSTWKYTMAAPEKPTYSAKPTGYFQPTTRPSAYTTLAKSDSLDKTLKT